MQARAFTESLLSELAKRRAVAPRGAKENANDFINRLRDAGVLPQVQASDLHWIRIAGNKAVHGGGVTASSAKQAVALLQSVALWCKSEFLERAVNPKSGAEQKDHRSQPLPREESRSAEARYSFRNSGAASHTEEPIIVQRRQSPTLTSEDEPGSRYAVYFALVCGLIFAVVMIGTFYSGGGSPDNNSVPTTPILTPGGPSAAAPEDTPRNPPVPVVEQFAEPREFVIAAPSAFDAVFARSGPGESYSNVATFFRGTRVTGIGQSFDDQGKRWIQLSRGYGFVLESNLSPFSESDKTASQGPPESVPSTNDNSPTEAVPGLAEAVPNAARQQEIVGNVTRYDDTWNCLILSLSDPRVSVGDKVEIDVPNGRVEARIARINGTEACAEPSQNPPSDVVGKNALAMRIDR